MGDAIQAVIAALGLGVVVLHGVTVFERIVRRS